LNKSEGQSHRTQHAIVGGKGSEKGNRRVRREGARSKQIRKGKAEDRTTGGCGRRKIIISVKIRMHYQPQRAEPGDTRNPTSDKTVKGGKNGTKVKEKGLWQTPVAGISQPGTIRTKRNSERASRRERPDFLLSKEKTT